MLWWGCNVSTTVSHTFLALGSFKDGKIVSQLHPWCLHPGKLTARTQNGGLEDDFPFQCSMLIFRGVTCFPWKIGKKPKRNVVFQALLFRVYVKLQGTSAKVRLACHLIHTDIRYALLGTVPCPFPKGSVLNNRSSMYILYSHVYTKSLYKKIHSNIDVDTVHKRTMYIK